MSDKKPSFQRSAETTLLLSRLEKCAIGELISYDELSRTISRDIRVHRNVLCSALRMLLRDRQIAFGTVIGEGIRRLTDVEIISSADDTTSRVRRMAHRGIKKLSAVRESELSNEKLIEWHGKSSQLAAIALMTKPSGLKVLESTIREKKSVLPPAETLKLFAK